jgi:hypothetical protein
MGLGSQHPLDGGGDGRLALAVRNHSGDGRRNPRRSLSRAGHDARDRGRTAVPTLWHQDELEFDEVPGV